MLRTLHTGHTPAALASKSMLNNQLRTHPSNVVCLIVSFLLGTCREESKRAAEPSQGRRHGSRLPRSLQARLATDRAYSAG